MIIFDSYNESTSQKRESTLKDFVDLISKIS